MALVIGGHPRSGTTLLRRLCAMHPEVMVTMESACFMQVGRAYGFYMVYLLYRWWQRTRYPMPILLQDNKSPEQIRLENHRFFLRYVRAISGHRQGVVTHLHIENALRDMFPGVSQVGDKYPDYVFHLDRLGTIPGISCIVIYRDCRDVVSSYLKMVRTKWRGYRWAREQGTADRIAQRWMSAIDHMERNRNRLHIIRYEDLVQAPEPVLSELGEYLGVDPAGFRMKMITDSCVGNYQHGLTSAELAHVVEIAGPIMEKLEYRLSGVAAR